MSYLETNRLQWDKRTSIHKDSDFYDLQGFLDGKNKLHALEIEEVGHVKGKSLLHLQCHFGLDTLSWARLGAKVTGIDISPQAIELAQSTAAQAKLDAQFIVSDVYSVNENVKDHFDIVFTSYGTIVWLDDLTKWAEVITARLKKGGFFYMIDFHPLVESYDSKSMELKYPYFNTGPVEEFGQHTYTDGPELNMTEITFSHSFSEIINSLISVGLKLEFFNEFDYTTHDCFENMVEFEPRKYRFKEMNVAMPMMYSMKWRKING